MEAQERSSNLCWDACVEFKLSKWRVAGSMSNFTVNVQDKMSRKACAAFSAYCTDEGVIDAGWYTFFVDISSVI
jgi:hypothetical protein